MCGDLDVLRQGWRTVLNTRSQNIPNNNYQNCNVPNLFMKRFYSINCLYETLINRTSRFNVLNNKE